MLEPSHQFIPPNVKVHLQKGVHVRYSKAKTCFPEIYVYHLFLRKVLGHLNYLK